jgi:thiamine pyrophosphate-dependent acetolactate synthase large subunit-like protein
MVAVGARFDDRVTGGLDAFAPARRRSTSTWSPSSIGKNVRCDIGIVGDAGNVLEDMIAAWKGRNLSANKAALKAWWTQIDGWRARQLVRLPARRQADQAAVRHPAPVRADQGPRHLHHHRGRPAPDVGRPVLPLRRARTAG